MSSSADDLQNTVKQMLQDINILLPEIIARIKPNNKKATKPSSTKYHRLLVLLDAAEQTLNKLPEKIVNPWFLAELNGMIEVIKKWRNDPIWKEIEPSLVNSSDFTHTIATLRLAEHLRGSGHEIEIVPVSKTPTPDLKIRAIGGTQEWISIECYQPVALDGRNLDLTPAQIKSIVTKTRDKARAQIGRGLGLMAVCGYNQPKVNILKLKQAFYEGLEKTPRLNLCGVVLEILGVLYRKTEGGFSWQPTITVEYIENPKYFGTVNIVFKMDEADPHLIRESLTQINTSDLMDGKLSLNPSTTLRFSESTIKAPSRETLLDIIDEIDKDRTILETKSNTLRTFFRGEGNINYVCGKCSRLLAENIWELSLSNIILKCPNCGLYNNISLVKNPPDPKLKKLACVQGENIVDAPIEIKRGIQFIGVKMDEKELQRSRIATLRSR